MRPAFIALLLASAGCPPPDAPVEDGEPAIHILYPPDGAAFVVGDDGRANFPVVVAIDDFELVPPGERSGQIEGEGHYHLYVEPIGIFEMPELAFHELSVPGVEGEMVLRRVRVELNHHNHTAVGCDHCEYAVEVEIHWEAPG